MLINMKYPASEKNSYLDGKVHKIEPKELLRLNDSNYYMLRGFDNSYNVKMYTILRDVDGIFYKVPLDDYQEFQNNLSNFNLSKVSLECVEENVDSLPFMTFEQLRNEILSAASKESGNPVNKDFEERVKVLCDELNLLDEEGYLSRRNSRLIAELRGKEMEPNLVYHIDSVAPNEIIGLVRYLENENKSLKKTTLNA